jgi:hypothetical protein
MIWIFCASQRKKMGPEDAISQIIGVADTHQLDGWISKNYTSLFHHDHRNGVSPFVFFQGVLKNGDLDLSKPLSFRVILQ